MSQRLVFLEKFTQSCQKTAQKMIEMNKKVRERERKKEKFHVKRSENSILTRAL